MYDAEVSPQESQAGADRTARRQAMLERLAEIGMEIACALGDQALAAAKDDPSSPKAVELGQAFDRLARGVRNTLALEARLQHQAEASRRRAIEDRRAEDAQAFFQYRRRRVARIVEGVIRSGVDRHFAPTVRGQLYERLADPSEDITGQPVGAIVARICQRLSLTPSASLWKSELWDLEDTPRSSPAGGGGSPQGGETEGAQAPSRPSG